VAKTTAQSRLPPSHVPCVVRLGCRRRGLEIMWPSSTRIRACSRRWYAQCVQPTLPVTPTISRTTSQLTLPWSTGPSETRRYPFLRLCELALPPSPPHSPSPLFPYCPLRPLHSPVAPSLSVPSIPSPQSPVIRFQLCIHWNIWNGSRMRLYRYVHVTRIFYILTTVPFQINFNNRPGKCTTYLLSVTKLLWRCM
jgi:hypothetical protein